MSKKLNRKSKIAFVSSQDPEARAARSRLKATYGSVAAKNADVIVALGGDGLMLECMHRFMNSGVPIFGMNKGTVGFLMNDGNEDADLRERLKAAVQIKLHPLTMKARTNGGRARNARAFNEVSLLRQERQAAKIRVTVDGVVRIEELICDGILLATPAGTTAYNLSAHGPILPVDAGILALTPISAFRPRRWRGALLPHEAIVRFDILEKDKRPVSAVADNTEVRDVTSIEVWEDRQQSVRILFDPEHNLEDRILNEQFMP